MRKMWQNKLKCATEYPKTHHKEDYDAHKLKKHTDSLKESLAFLDREENESRRQIDDINIACAKFYPGWQEKPVIKHRGFAQRLKDKLFGQAHQRQ